MPLRTCIACRTKTEQAGLLRLALHGLIAHGPSQGRSAYICPQSGCIEQAFLKGRLSRAFKEPVPEATLNMLRDALECQLLRKPI